MANFDPFDSATLTTLVNHSLETAQEQQPTIGEQLIPTVQIEDTEVSIEVNDVEAFGKGQFRAPNASPALVEFAAQRRKEVMELVLLDEMNRVNEKDWKNLNSSDAAVRRKAGVSLLDRGRMLAIRNRRLKEAMRWDALDGEAVVTYPNGSQLKIDYGIPSEHKPTASVLWSDLDDSDPIEDIKTWQELSADALGFYGLNIYMSSETWELILKNDKVASYLTGTDRPLLIPKKEDVMSLLREGTNITITDAGYRDEGVGVERGRNTLTRYLPKNKVLITTQPNIDGERIADFVQGQVTISTGYNSTDDVPGPASEVIVDHRSKQHLLRYASSGIVRVHQPTAFVWATVSA